MSTARLCSHCKARPEVWPAGRIKYCSDSCQATASYLRNKERRAVSTAAWVDKNREYVNRKAREWQARNREAVRLKDKLRKAKRRKLAVPRQLVCPECHKLWICLKKHHVVYCSTICNRRAATRAFHRRNHKGMTLAELNGPPLSKADCARVGHRKYTKEERSSMMRTIALRTWAARREDALVEHP